MSQPDQNSTTDIVARLRGSYPPGPARYVLLKAADEIERLQRIIDSRPAINAALPDSYIKWSQTIYAMEASHVTETRQ